jgi:hypothetical protein
VAGVQIIVQHELERRWAAGTSPDWPHSFQLLGLQAHKLGQLLLLCKVQGAPKEWAHAAADAWTGVVAMQVGSSKRKDAPMQRLA